MVSGLSQFQPDSNAQPMLYDWIPTHSCNVNMVGTPAFVTDSLSTGIDPSAERTRTVDSP